MKIILLISVILAAMLLSACAAPITIPTATPAPTSAPAVTATVTPTFAPRPTQTREQTLPSIPASPTIPVATLPPTASPNPTPILWKMPSSTVTFTVDSAHNQAICESGNIQLYGPFYLPPGKGPYPAILVLHTGGGLSSHESSFASWLSSQGYVAFAPDYFRQIGVTVKTFDQSSFWAKSIDQVDSDLAIAIEGLKSQSYVAKELIGAVGFSLGGYFCLTLSTRDDIKGVVIYYGALNVKIAEYSYTDLAMQVKAPILMFHGDADTFCPIGAAQAVQSLLEGNGKQSQLVIYPGVTHQFDFTSGANPAAIYNAKATADANSCTLAFLQENLK